MSDTADPPPDRRAVRYLNRISDVPDQLLFFATFVIGMSLIVSLKVGQEPQWVVTAVPCGLTVLYPILSWFTPKFRMREDRIAENCYYLGLLFTLVSLACALFAFTMDVDATRTIVSDFGIALATTILGVALRVFISQLRVDPVEYEREARTELAESASHLTAQLYETVGEFASFRRAMGQTLSDGLTEISTQSREALTENTAKFAEVASSVLIKIDSAFDQFNEQAARMNVIAGQTVQAFEALLHRLEEMDASPDLVSRKIEPLVQGFRDVLTAAQERARSQKADFDRITKVAEVSRASIEQVITTLQTAEAASRTGGDRLTAEANRASAAISAISSSFSGLVAAIKTETLMLQTSSVAARNSLAADLAEIQARRAELQNEVRQANALVVQVHGSLLSLVEVITEGVGAER